MLEQKRGSIS